MKYYFDADQNYISKDNLLEGFLACSADTYFYWMSSYPDWVVVRTKVMHGYRRDYQKLADYPLIQTWIGLLK